MCESESFLGQWKIVLIEWVNCLGIAKHVDIVSDLENGDFFRKILKLLSKQSVADILPDMYSFLKAQYPNIHLEITNPLSDYDLTVLASLLMHYTCVCDRRDSLTSPLCYNLTEATQLSIKCFLEGISNDSSELEIKKMMKFATMNKDNAACKTPCLYTCHSGGDSPALGSPLQDFLRTPAYKSGRVQEKDKEIKRLRMELQTEKYEKEDLLMELNDYKGRLKTISHQLNEKSVTISKLHSELLEIESRDPPHKSRELMEIEKLLRVELQDSQSYIQQLQTEQEELQNMKEELATKLKNSEMESCLWQERAITYESKCENLTEVNKNQELELNGLRINCNELSALLEELKAVKRNDNAYLDVSAEGFKSPKNVNHYENLACSVVEVQLLEVQKENDDLAGNLKESELRSKKLEQDMLTLTHECAKLNENYESLQSYNEDLESKIVLLRETQKGLESTNQELLVQVSELTRNNEIKQEELDMLQNSLYDTKNALCESDILVKSIQKDLSVMQKSYEDLQVEIVQRDDQYGKLKVESDSVQKLYKETLDNYNRSQFDALSFQKLYKELDNGIEQHLKNLEDIIDVKETDYTNRLDAFGFLLNKLKMSNESKETIYEIEICKSRELIKGLEEEVRLVKEKESLGIQTVNKLNAELDVAKHQVKTLEVTLDEQSKKIDTLNSIIKDLKLNIVDLEGLKLIITKKCEEFEESNEDLSNRCKLKQDELKQKICEEEKLHELIKELDGVRFKLGKEVEEVKEELRSKTQGFHEKEDELTKVKDEVDVLREEYLTKSHEHLKMINELNNSIAGYEERIVVLETDLKISIDQCQQKQMQLDDLAKLKTEIESQYLKQSEDLQKKIDLLELTYGNLAIDYEKSVEEKKKLYDDTKDLEVKLSDLNVEKGTYMKKCDALKKEIMDLADKLAKKELVCIEKDDLISNSNRELLVLKLQLENKNEDILSLKQKTDLLHNSKMKIQQQFDKAVCDNDELKKKLENLTLEMDILQKLKCATENKYLELETNVQNMFDQLDIKNDNLVDNVDRLLHFKEDTLKEIEKLRQSLLDANQQLNKANEERFTVTSENETIIRDLNDKILNLNLAMDEYRKQEILNLQEIGMLKEELTYNMGKYTEALQSEKDLKIENEIQVDSLSENISNLLTKYNELDNKHVDIICELNDTKKCLQIAEGHKQKLEIEVVKMKKQYEEDCLAAAEDYKKQLDELMQNEEKYQRNVCELKDQKNELRRVKDKLESVNEERTQLLIKIESLIKSNKEFEDNYKHLNIDHENYLKESASTLERTRNELDDTVLELGKLKDQHQEEILELEKSLKQCTLDLANLKMQNAAENKEKDAEIYMLRIKLAEFEETLIKMRFEQSSLKTQLENDEHMKHKYSQLQCAYDILETGKNKFEERYEELLNKYNLLIDDKQENDERFKMGTVEFEKRINDLQSELCDKITSIRANDLKIKEYTDEILTINNIVASMDGDKKELIKSFENRLEVIEEDNNRKLAEKVSAFKHVKSKYLQMKQEILKLHNDYEYLKDQLVNAAQEKQDTEKCIKEKEDELNAMRNKYESLSSSLSDLDSVLANLQEELQSKVSALETISAEKQVMQVKLSETAKELEGAQRAREEIYEKHSKLIEDTEMNLLRAHDNAVDVKNDLMSRISHLENELEAKHNVELILKQEQKAKQFFELQLLEVSDDKHKHQMTSKKLKEIINRLIGVIYETPIDDDLEDKEMLDQLIIEAEDKLIKTFANLRELKEVVTVLENDKIEIIKKLAYLENANQCLEANKSKILDDYERLHLEKVSLAVEKDKEEKCFENLKYQYDLLKKKCENDNNEELNCKLLELKASNDKNYADYLEFVGQVKLLKKEIDSMITQRNALESLVCTLRESHIVLQIRASYITEESHKLHYDQKVALEIIVEDIQKQFSRYTKMAYNISLNTCQIFEKTVNGILSNKPVQWQRMIKDLDISEVLDKLDDLKDNVINTMEQLKSFEKTVEKFDFKPNNQRLLKENMQQQPKVTREDDWKKKYLTVKQRLTLMENAKNNYEKRNRQLKEEMSKLSQPPQVATKNDDLQYRSLLQKHMEFKDEHARILKEKESALKEVSEEFESYKSMNHNSIIERNEEIRNELDSIRAAYTAVLNEKAHLDGENATLRKLLDDRDSQLADLQAIKQSYEKLFEYNNKLKSEIDTLKYKMSRDREESIKMKKDFNCDVTKRIQDVREEYEVKLKKMKNKMIELYKEESDKQLGKAAEEKQNNVTLAQTIEKLRNDLSEYEVRLRNAESEKSVALKQLSVYQSLESGDRLANSRESFYITSSRESLPAMGRLFESRMMGKRASTQSLGRDLVRSTTDEDRGNRCATLPRNINSMDVIEEVRISRKTSINAVAPANMEMEDEGDLFNNKFLVDLKEGKCNLASGRDSTSSRMSELAYRNSLCPPHLKSSYAAETQFLAANKYKEDELKAGHVDFDDSMSTRLLPFDKPKKKDAGTTTYKKPGPPTPSKHGGRLSLQGSEQHPRDVLKDNNTEKTPKRTPNKLMSLFSRSSLKDTSENAVPVTPKEGKKRLRLCKKYFP